MVLTYLGNQVWYTDTEDERPTGAQADVAVIFELPTRALFFYDGADWLVGAGGGAGEVNTASNVGSAGVGPFKQKSIFDLQFKKLNALSNKVAITDDTGNSKIDFDVAEANLTLANQAGNLGYSKLTLTNAIVNADIAAAAAIAYSKLNVANSIGNADIATAAGITYSKLVLTDSILNADINASAAIAYGKLALTNSIVNADINSAAAIPYSKLNLVGTILNADVNASAAIAWSKLDKTGSILDDIADVIITTPAGGDVPTWDAGTSKWVNQQPPGAGGGEANTISNIGTAGVGIWKQKVGINHELKKINAGSSKITITDDTGANEVDVDLATTLAGMTLTTPVVNGVKEASAAKTANYTLTTADTVIRANANPGAFTLTLPAASGNTGLRYTIIRTDVTESTNLLTVDANASELIDGNLTYILFPGEFIEIQCDGTGWVVLNRPQPTGIGYYFEKGATANRRYIAGMIPTTTTLVNATVGPAVNVLYAMPFILARTTKFDTISCEVTTGGAGSEIHLGIYRDNGNVYPGALIFDSLDIDSSTTGVKNVTITAAVQILQPGLYWLAYENSATVPLIRALPSSPQRVDMGMPSTIGSTNHALCWTVTHTVGTLPNPFTGGGTRRAAPSIAGDPIPLVALRPI